jgi:hypothetical protein
MNHFTSVKDLISLLARGKSLLSEMFEKRKLLSYKREHAQELLANEDGVLQLLIQKGVIHENGAQLELDEQYLQFFELVLEVNEEISIASVDENIRQVREEYMVYYLQSASEAERHKYLKAVKAALKKIGRITQRNLIDLSRNIDNTFNTEPNYQIKLTKLERQKEKLKAIQALIEQSEMLVTEEEQTFFAAASDEELRMIVLELRLALTSARQNLIEIRKQIIEYINQVKYQSSFIAHLRQVKYLRDQYELKAKTNLVEVLYATQAVCLERKPAYPLKLSLARLQGDEYFSLIQKVNATKGRRAVLAAKNAASLQRSDLEPAVEREVPIDLLALKNAFVASGHQLFDFVMQYAFPREVDFAERVTIFCQLIAIYEAELNIEERYQQHGAVEYVMVYPK